MTVKRKDMPRIKKIAVRGLVIPAAWDRRGRVTSIVFAADDEKEYKIRPDGTLREFLGLIHRELEVVGWTSTTRDRLHLLDVEHYQVLGQPALNQSPT
jgi:hypothetical protein